MGHQLQLLVVDVCAEAPSQALTKPLSLDASFVVLCAPLTPSYRVGLGFGAWGMGMIALSTTRTFVSSLSRCPIIVNRKYACIDAFQERQHISELGKWSTRRLCQTAQRASAKSSCTTENKPYAESESRLDKCRISLMSHACSSTPLLALHASWGETI